MSIPWVRLQIAVWGTLACNPRVKTDITINLYWVYFTFFLYNALCFFCESQDFPDPGGLVGLQGLEIIPSLTSSHQK